MNNLFRKLDQRIPFEYTTVSRISKCPEEYKKAFNIWISFDTAIQVIEQMCKKYNVSHKKLICHLRDYTDGEHHGSRGGIKKGVPWISIAGYHGCVNGWLLCHEMSHVIHFSRYKTIKDRTVHGRAFTEILDRVIIFYNEMDKPIEDMKQILTDFICDVDKPSKERANAVKIFDSFDGYDDPIGDDEMLISDFIAELYVLKEFEENY